ncbi:hypothetical protein, conserved [Eimeria necatrix]|uniref:Uncharacterized protein n=1 Tax=Eimeria necatrix TaxID=51315 RepID=U6MTP4_9EIME|nr:hypothetical protein, conserved [Eimeria necatrix]CDJ67391.1 hypothetical protein, conserved [Eimeria necatrix]
MDPSVVAFDDTTKSHDSDKELCSSSSLPDQQEDLGEKSSHTTPSDDKGSKSTDSVREEGLRAFRAGDWRGATDAWSRGLRTLEYILAKEDEFDDDKKREFAAMHQSYLLNLSLSCLKEGRWAACILYSDKALQNDPNALKALYRKAQAQQELGDFDGALATVNRYLTVSPGSPLALSLRSQLNHLKATHAIKEKKLVKGMFRKLEHDPRSEAVEATATETARSKTSVLGSLGRKLIGWLDLFGHQKRVEQPEIEQNRDAFEKFNAANARAQLNLFEGAGCGPSFDDRHKDAVAKALAAMAGERDLDPEKSSNSEDIQRLARLVDRYQKLHRGDASLIEKLRFHVYLVLFGIKQIASKACRSCWRRKRICEKSKGSSDWEEVEPEVARTSGSATLKGDGNRATSSIASRRKQHCATSEAARRNRKRRNHSIEP